jgi:hypothetical protein
LSAEPFEPDEGYDIWEVDHKNLSLMSDLETLKLAGVQFGMETGIYPLKNDLSIQTTRAYPIKDILKDERFRLISGVAATMTHIPPDQITLITPGVSVERRRGMPQSSVEKTSEKDLETDSNLPQESAIIEEIPERITNELPKNKTAKKYSIIDESQRLTEEDVPKETIPNSPDDSTEGSTET